MARAARARAAQCQGRADGTRDATARRTRECIWNGHVFNQGGYAWSGGRCLRNDRRESLGRGPVGALVNPILICRDCDTVYRDIPLRRGDVALCRRCDAVLARYSGGDVESGLALIWAATFFCAITILFPLLRVVMAGNETKSNIWFAVRSLQQGWVSGAAFGLAFTA